MTDPSPPQAEPATETPERSLSVEVVHRLKQLGPVVFALGIMSLTVPGILGSVLLFGTAAKAEALQNWVQSLGPQAPWIAAALFAVTTGSALLPTYALSFACGVIFGSFAIGGTVAMAGVVGGALIGYAWGALLARGRVMGVIESEPRAATIRRALVDRSLATEAYVVGLIRVPPSSPFALSNLVMSSARVSLPAYTIGTLVGIAPRTLFAVWVGVVTGNIAESGARSRWYLIVGVGLAVAVFLYLGRLFGRWAREALSEQAGEDPAA